MSGIIVEFNGDVYERSEKSRYYFKKTTRNAERINANQLHRAVWEYHNGKIPDGYQIHHKDGNVDNNEISNLECIKRSEHLSFHSQKNEKNEEYVQKRKKLLGEIRPLASAWHKSEEGKEWHRKHVKNSIGKVHRETIQCEFCKNEFEALPWQRYCSQSCQEKARRRRIGLKFDRSEKICACCGNSFLPNAHNQVFCSISCKQKFYKKRE